MEATVDVAKQDGKTLADAPRASALAQTQAFASQDDGAEAEVRRVIAANTGRGPAVMGAAAATSTASAAASTNGTAVH
jgi:membrane fusion protein (multidrug efflux system)